MSDSTPVCRIPECGLKLENLKEQLCNGHYQRYRKTGDPLPKPKPVVPLALQCSVDECARPIKHQGRRLCTLHNGFFLRTGDPAKRPKSGIKDAEPCRVDGCDILSVNKTQQLCTMHLHRMRARGTTDPSPASEKILPPCSVDGCEKITHNELRQLCNAHYQRWRKHGDASKPLPEYPKACTMQGCEKEHAANGLCATHDMRRRRTGRTDLAPKLERAWVFCEATGCIEIVQDRFCSTHHGRYYRTGDANYQPVRIVIREHPDFCEVQDCNAPYFAKGKCAPHHQAAYHQANAEYRRQKMREHYEANRDDYNLKAARRRRGMAAGMSEQDREISSEYRKAIADDPCAYCGGVGVETDHVFPVALGGKDYWWNLTRSCMPCNRRKAGHCGTWFILGGRGPIVQNEIRAIA